jgi:TPR repeat protein
LIIIIPLFFHALKQFKSIKLKKQLIHIKLLAEQGDAIAQCNLGLYYATGRNVNQDSTQAIMWYRKSADQGYYRAQWLLGKMYESGKGVKQDYKEATKWYKKAANQGDGLAQYSLGLIYEDGEGVKKDDKEAIKWYKKAAEKDDPYAQYHLGKMYEKGSGVMQDYKLAYFWYNISISSIYNDDLFKDFRKTVIIDCKQIEKFLTIDEMTNLKQKSYNWKPKTDL